MIETWLHAYNHAPACIDETEAPLNELIEEQRRVWNEEPEGMQLFWFIQGGILLATMMRDASDPEVAHTSYCDGTKETHRCHYVLTPEGMYDRSEVTRLDEPLTEEEHQRLFA